MAKPKEPRIICNICGADVTDLTWKQLLDHLSQHGGPVAPNSIFGVR